MLYDKNNIVISVLYITIGCISQYDLINILSELTRRTISTDNPIKYTEEILEKMLILGYRTVVNTLDVQNCVDIILT